MTPTPSASPPRQLAWLSLAMFLGMTLWFSATAANAPIVREFHLTTGETAWLTMAVQGGFVIGTLLSALLNLADVINARRLFAIGCVVAAASNAALVRAGGSGVAHRAARRHRRRARVGLSAGHEDRGGLVSAAARRRARRGSSVR